MQDYTREQLATLKRALELGGARDAEIDAATAARKAEARRRGAGERAVRSRRKAARAARRRNRG